MTNNADIPKYSMIIEWSPANDSFVAAIPELPGCRTHGASYEEAAANGVQIMELVAAGLVEDDLPVPSPHSFRFDEPVGVRKTWKNAAIRRVS